MELGPSGTDMDEDRLPPRPAPRESIESVLEALAEDQLAEDVIEPPSPAPRESISVLEMATDEITDNRLLISGMKELELERLPGKGSIA